MHDSPGLGLPTPSRKVTSVPELGIPYMEFRFLLGFVFFFTQAVTAAEIAGDVTLECGWRLGAAIRQVALDFYSRYVPFVGSILARSIIALDLPFRF